MPGFRKHMAPLLGAGAAALLHTTTSAALLQLTPSAGANSFGATISDDGRRVAFYSASNPTGQNPDQSFEIHVYDRPTNTLRQISSFAGGGLAGGNQTPVISGDGNRVTFQHFETSGGFGHFQTQLFDLGTSTLSSLTPLGNFFELSDISRNGTRVSVNTDNTGLRIFDTTTHSFGPVLAFNPLNHSLSGDGTRLALETFSGALSVLDITTNTTRSVAPAGSGSNHRPSLSQDGRHLAFTASFDPLGGNIDHNAELFLFDVEAGTLRQLTHTTGGDSSMASISADGRRIAFSTVTNILGGNADGNTEIYVYDVLQDLFTQITDTTGPSFSQEPAISGDGLSLAFTSSADLLGTNPNRMPQVYLQDLAPLAQQVPEPSTLALVACAGAGLLGRRRRV